MSGDALFQSSEYYELLALHRTVMEAKFHPDPENLDIPGSPLVARMSERIVDALILAEHNRGNRGKADEWTEWRARPRAGRFWAVAIRHARAYRDWADLDRAEKRRFAIDVLAPFSVEETELDAFVAEVDSD